MTTPDEPGDGQDRTPGDQTTGAGGNHSAPRPVPPLAPPPPPPTGTGTTDDGSTTSSSPDPDATTVGRPVSPEGTVGTDSSGGVERRGATGDTTSAGSPSEEASDAAAPTRVSAFPAGARPAGSFPGSSDDGDHDRTTALPVATPSGGTGGEDTAAGRTTVIPTGASSATPTSADETSTSTTGSSTTRSRTSHDDADATRVVPLADPDALAGSTNGRLKAGSRDPLPEEDWAAAPTRRTGAHIWGVLGLLVAVPVAWFLLTDGALRTYYGLPPESALNPAGLLSLGGGLITLVIIAVVTRVTSLGAWIWGGVVTLAGLAALIFPVAVDDWLTSSRDAFLTLHEGFGTNVHDYLVTTGRSGLLLLFGIVLLLLAFVSHGARRSGRYEGRVRAERDARGL